jgi:nucleoside-diphosphate-sugar epimerase
MRVVVTGGTGFIGRHLSRRLIQAGNEVIVLTRQASTHAARAIESLRYYSVDIREPDSLRCGLNEVGPVDIVYHLAADLDYFGRLSRLHAANVQGTEQVMRWARKLGAKKFVFTSSIEAIGPVGSQDMSAGTEPPCQPVSSYGVSKLKAERVALQLARELDINTAILRLGNVYGPGSFAFIPQIILAIMERRPLYRYLAEVQEHCTQLLYIDDAVEGLIRSEALLTIGRPIVFAHDRCTSVGDLFTCIGSLLGCSIERRKPRAVNRMWLSARSRAHRFRRRADFLTYLQAGGPHRPHRSYPIEDAIRQAGMESKTGLEEGIQRTVDWFLSTRCKEARA